MVKRCRGASSGSELKGDPAAVKAAAQAIVSLGDRSVADLGAMMNFYRSLAAV